MQLINTIMKATRIVTTVFIALASLAVNAQEGA